MNPVKIALGFVPFVLFGVLATWMDIRWAAAVSLLAALLVIAASARGGIKALPVVQAVELALVTVAAVAGGAHVQHLLDQYARGGVSLVLGLYILATASVAPFTEGFARQSVPREYWTTPRFRAINRRLSTVWGVAVLAVGVSHLIGGAVHDGHPLLTVILDWVVPVLALVRAVSETRRTIAAHQDQAPTPAT